MPGFRAPMINLYACDLSRTAAFFAGLGFIETFRTPASGAPSHVAFKLDGITLGIATLEAARDHHGLTPGDGRGIEIVLWTDDTDAALRRLAAQAARRCPRRPTIPRWPPARGLDRRPRRQSDSTRSAQALKPAGTRVSGRSRVTLVAISGLHFIVV